MAEGKLTVGNVDVLALTQGAQADGPLRRVRVALEPAGGAPLGQRGQAIGRLGGAQEVGNPAGEGQGKPAHPTALQQAPDAHSQGLLGVGWSSLIHSNPQ